MGAQRCCTGCGKVGVVCPKKVEFIRATNKESQDKGKIKHDEQKTVAFGIYNICSRPFGCNWGDCSWIFYLSLHESWPSSVNRAKSLEVDISALGFFLDTLKRGTGIATIAAATTWTLDTTVCEGTGSASVSSGTTILWRFYCNDTPTGASATTHYLSGTFYGFVE